MASQPRMLRIFCIGEDQGEPFHVKVADNETVDELKNLIKAKLRNSLASVDARDLALYEVNIQATEDEEIMNAVIQEMQKLDPSKKLNHGQLLPEAFTKPDEPGELPAIRILFVIPPPPKTSSHLLLKKNTKLTTRAPTVKVMCMSQLLELWAQPVPAHTVEDALAHIQRPLTEEEKVPISQFEFDRLLAPFSRLAKSRVKPSELSALFRISEEEESYHIEQLSLFALNMEPPQSGAKEAAFHCTWDINISEVLTLVLGGENVRNSSTSTQIPDYGFLVNNHCVFRGEETAPKSLEDPEFELISKFFYTYDPLPFVFGYFAVGTQVNYVAITRPTSSLPSETKPLFSHNLRDKKGRIGNLVHLIRLCGVMSWMGDELGVGTTVELRPIKCENGTEITLGQNVKKDFTRAKFINATAHVADLVTVYGLLKANGVPHIDSLFEFSIHPTNAYIITTPRGMDRWPESGTELFNAVVCILRALKVMHSGQPAIYHRDIRGPNILKKFRSDEWFLIDWSDASTAPTQAVTHMSKEEHSPRVRHDNHGAEVDIWGVGYYLKSLAAPSRPLDPVGVKKMGRSWMEDHGMTAAAALNEIMRSQHLFFKAEVETS